MPNIRNYYLIFKKDQLLVHEDLEDFILPQDQHVTTIDLQEYSIREEAPYLVSSNDSPFTIDGNYYLIDAKDDFPVPEDFNFVSFRECRDFYKDYQYSTAVIGQQLLNWNRKHIYCGVCASPLAPLNDERYKHCPSCGNMEFTQMSLAVITAIFKDDQILLAHNVNFAEGLYSLVAGFVDMSEPLEQTVAREIYEEVGLQVKNIKYFGSQPWPFPNSMMIGFTAEYESGDIQVDGIEIADAKWFNHDQLPMIPHGYSIARKIIDSYQDKFKK